MLTDKKKKFIFLKAAGLSQNEAVRKSYNVKSRRNASVIANRLMKQEEVKGELELLKSAFRREFVSRAFDNWDRILKKEPKGKLHWSDWIKANKDTFELAGLKETEDKDKVGKKIEFIKQFIIKEGEKTA